MKTSRFTKEQSTRAVHQAELAVCCTDVCLSVNARLPGLQPPYRGEIHSNFDFFRGLNGSEIPTSVSLDAYTTRFPIALRPGRDRQENPVGKRTGAYRMATFSDMTDPRVRPDGHETPGIAGLSGPWTRRRERIA